MPIVFTPLPIVRPFAPVPAAVPSRVIAEVPVVVKVVPVTASVGSADFV